MSIPREAETMQEWSDSDAEGANDAAFPTHAEELKERAQRRKDRAESLELELAHVERTIADLRKRETVLRDRVLLP